MEPALTPEEWAERRIAPLSCDEIAIYDDGDGLEFATYPDATARAARKGLLGKYKLAIWDDAGIAGLIALANVALSDDSPYKITRADVDRLLLIAAEIRRGLAYGPDAVDLERLARKLAALLPPR